ncbi:MAG: polysaccharide biosynthesis tyrosine autokinase, partial [Luteibaculum sp.]
GFYTAYRIPNVYRAQSQFLYKGDQNEMMNARYGANPYMYRGTDGENQKRIITSYDLVGDVIDRMNFEISYYVVGRLRKTIQYPSTAFKIQVDTINDEMVGVPILFEFTKEVIRTSYVLNRQEIVEEFPYQPTLSGNRFQFQFIPDRGDIESYKSYLSTYEVVVNSRNSLINQFRNKLNVNTQDRSSVITASINDLSVERAIDFLDTLAVVYANFSTRMKREENKRSLEFIEDQIATVTASINQSEYEVEGVKEAKSIINLTAEQTRYNTKLIEYEDALLQLRMKRQRLQQLKDYLDAANEQNFMPPSIYIPEGDEFLKSKLEELYKNLKEREASLFDKTPENPLVVRNKQLFKNVQKELSEYIEKTLTALEQERREIEGRINKYENYLRSLPQSQREILNIERRIAVNEKLYNYLLEQRATKIIEGASINPEFEILDSARSFGVVGPQRSKMIQNYTLYGLAIVLAIGAIRFFFLDKIESLKEMQDNTSKNVLAGIPRFKEIMGFSDPDYMNSDQAYAFRKLRTSVQFLANSQQKEAELILVTSMYPSEGKTFVSSSLGNLHSLSGKKVALIDFDLHKPNLHKQFGLDKNIAGLSMVLTGHASFEESFQEVSPNLHVLTSGPLPPNPSELVIREETIQLLQQLRQEYDVVIVDTPPVVPVTDAKNLMKFSDVNIVVLNQKHASRRNLGAIEDLITEVGEANTGIVFNAIKTPPLMALYGKYAYKYGYTYGYNYGYGYEYAYRYGKSRSKD